MCQKPDHKGEQPQNPLPSALPKKCSLGIYRWEPGAGVHADFWKEMVTNSNLALPHGRASDTPVLVCREALWNDPLLD